MKKKEKTKSINKKKLFQDVCKTSEGYFATSIFVKTRKEYLTLHEMVNRTNKDDLLVRNLCGLTVYQVTQQCCIEHAQTTYFEDGSLSDTDVLRALLWLAFCAEKDILGNNWRIGQATIDGKRYVLDDFENFESVLSVECDFVISFASRSTFLAEHGKRIYFPLPISGVNKKLDFNFPTSSLVKGFQDFYKKNKCRTSRHGITLVVPDTGTRFHGKKMRYFWADDALMTGIEKVKRDIEYIKNPKTKPWWWEFGVLPEKECDKQLYGLYIEYLFFVNILPKHCVSFDIFSYSDFEEKGVRMMDTFAVMAEILKSGDASTVDLFVEQFLKKGLYLGKKS